MQRKRVLSLFLHPTRRYTDYLMITSRRTPMITTIRHYRLYAAIKRQRAGFANSFVDALDITSCYAVC